MKMKDIVNTFITGEELRESNPTAFKRLKINFVKRHSLAKEEGLPHIDESDIHKKVIIGEGTPHAFEMDTVEKYKPKIKEFLLKLKFPTHCIITGIKLDYDYDKKRVNGGGDNAPSYDRITPKKGYVEGNVRVVSQLANRMLNNVNSQENIKLIYKNLINFFQKELGEAK